jgi:hypothetical protein
MTLRNIPYVIEACDVNGDGLGATDGTNQAIYMPKNNEISASILLIRVQSDLTISGTPSVDSDLFDFTYGDTETYMTTIPNNTGIQIPLTQLNQKMGYGEFLGYIKAPSGKRVILLFLP